MGERVIRVPDPSAKEFDGSTRKLDPSGTALVVAVSGSVLVASLLIASMSVGAGVGRGPAAAIRPAPAPPPTLVTPAP